MKIKPIKYDASIIDFDIAVIDDNYKSRKIKSISDKYGDDYYIKFKEQCIEILSKFI